MLLFITTESVYFKDILFINGDMHNDFHFNLSKLPLKSKYHIEHLEVDKTISF